MPRMIVSEADGTFELEKWRSGHVYTFQEILELCWKRQNYIDSFKKLSGGISPFLVIPRIEVPWGFPAGRANCD